MSARQKSKNMRLLMLLGSFVLGRQICYFYVLLIGLISFNKSTCGKMYHNLEITIALLIVGNRGKSTSLNLKASLFCIQEQAKKARSWFVIG
jgi:hypothetical protein